VKQLLRQNLTVRSRLRSPADGLGVQRLRSVTSEPRHRAEPGPDLAGLEYALSATSNRPNRGRLDRSPRLVRKWLFRNCLFASSALVACPVGSVELRGRRWTWFRRQARRFHPLLSRFRQERNRLDTASDLLERSNGGRPGRRFLFSSLECRGLLVARRRFAPKRCVALRCGGTAGGGTGCRRHPTRGLWNPAATSRGACGARSGTGRSNSAGGLNPLEQLGLESPG
jgi:hypothetical protein